MGGVNMKCEICGSEVAKDALGLDELVWMSVLVVGIVSIDAHPTCVKKAILTAGELIS